MQDFLPIGEAVAPCPGGVFVELRCRHFSLEPTAVAVDGGSWIIVRGERVSERAGAGDADRIGRHPPALGPAALDAPRRFILHGHLLVHDLNFGVVATRN